MALEDPSDDGPLAVLRDGLARNGPFASHAKMGATLPVDSRPAASANAAKGARSSDASRWSRLKVDRFDCLHDPGDGILHDILARALPDSFHPGQ